MYESVYKQAGLPGNNSLHRWQVMQVSSTGGSGSNGPAMLNGGSSAHTYETVVLNGFRSSLAFDNDLTTYAQSGFATSGAFGGHNVWSVDFFPAAQMTAHNLLQVSLLSLVSLPGAQAALLQSFQVTLSACDCTGQQTWPSCACQPTVIFGPYSAFDWATLPTIAGLPAFTLVDPAFPVIGVNRITVEQLTPNNPLSLVEVMVQTITPVSCQSEWSLDANVHCSDWSPTGCSTPNNCYYLYTRTDSGLPWLAEGGAPCTDLGQTMRAAAPCSCTYTLPMEHV